MPPDARLAALVEHISAFHITDRAMRSAQSAVTRALENGELGDADRLAYLDAVRRYFSGFEREARAHLKDVDRRLEQANQVRFNLMAERGVAVKRIEATVGVLAQLDAVEERPSP
jgi:hypothetical protein